MNGLNARGPGTDATYGTSASICFNALAITEPDVGAKRRDSVLSGKIFLKVRNSNNPDSLVRALKASNSPTTAERRPALHTTQKEKLTIIKTKSLNDCKNQMKMIVNALRSASKVKAFAFSRTGIAILALSSVFGLNTEATAKNVKFDLVRSPALAGLPNFLPNAGGTVSIRSLGSVEVMKVQVFGLPPNTDFDFFVIQVPLLPFGLSWYQGDIETDEHGEGKAEFIGRFSIETFIVAPGVAPAPADPFSGPFPDASVNPATNPVQLYHLGLWFNNPADAVKAGGPGIVTPFNGEHDAGIQILNTSEFPETDGPLRQVQ